MTFLKKLARDSFWLLIARLVAQGSLVIVTFLIAARLGATGLGQYAFLAAVIGIGNVITTFGSDMVLIREVAQKKDLALAPSVLVLQLLLSLLFIGLTILVAPYIRNQSEESISALQVYSFSMIPLSFFTVFTSLLRGVQKMTAYAVLNLGMAVLLVSAMAVSIRQGTSILSLAYVLLGVQVAGMILAGWLCYPLLAKLKRWNISFDTLTSLVVISLPIASISILGILYQRLSLTLIAILGSASLTGIFSAAARVVEAARLGHVAVLTALYPAFANPETAHFLQGRARYSGTILLTLSLMGSGLIYFLSEPIITLLFGARFEPSIVVLRILAFTLIPFTVNSYLSVLFLAGKMEKRVLLILMASLLILAAMNLWLIPALGPVGAAWATLSAETVQAFLFLLAWVDHPFHQLSGIPKQGVTYELSDTSQ